MWSGAGKGLKESSLFCEVNDSLTAYKTGAHRHQSELNQEFPGHTIVFSPHLSPQNRGILCSIYMENTAGLTQEALVQLYQDYYSDEPFVHVTSEDCPSTRSSVGSNLCVITPKVLPDSNTIVIFASIDNLVKGAAGQAVQVLNLIYGFDETTGLSQIPRHI